MVTARSVDPSVSRTPIPSQANDLATVCVLCSHNCGIRVDIDDNRITSVRGDDRSPITHGYLCNKAFSIQHYVEHAQRTTHPLRRRADGSFERIGWDTAIQEIAAKLLQIRVDHGARAIGLVGIGGQANHMDAMFALGFLRGLGTRKWFNAFAQEKTQHNLMDQWMFEASPTTLLHADQARSQFMLVMGTNPRISNRGHNANDSFPAFAADKSRKMVVVDPRETETTKSATRHLRIRPGTDAYLMLGMAAAIIQGELVDARFLHEQTHGFEELRRALEPVDPADMAGRCGISLDDLTRTAAEFAQADSASIFYDLGIEQTPFSTLNSYLIRILLALTGNVGRAGGNIFMETLVPPAFEPGRASESERALASGIPAIRALGNMGMFSPTLCPEEITVDHPERLRALIVEGSNPILSYSDAPRWREAREKLELLVVIDPAMTETAEMADYVLPTPTGYEKWEMANFPKGYPEVYVQLRPPVVAGPPEALPEPEIYTRLVEALDLFGPPPHELSSLAEHALSPEGGAMYMATAQQIAVQSGRASDPTLPLLFWSYRTVGNYLPSPALVSPWMACGINALLRGESVLRTLGPDWHGRGPFEIADELFRRILAHPEGVEIARSNEQSNLADHVGFDDKRIRLAPEPMLAEIARAITTLPAHDPEFPFILAAGLRTRWTANTIQRDPAWRKGRGPHCSLNLSPGDASKLGVSSGDEVRVRTRRGSLTMPAQVDPKLMDGHVWMPNGFGNLYPAGDGVQPVGGNQNELTDVRDRDPFTGIPHHRYVPCRIERL